MATAKELDTSLLNTSCRILVLSCSLIQATSLAHRIISLGNGSPSPPPPENKAEDSASSSFLGSSYPTKIPWKISNKYYNADVHFAMLTVHGLDTQHFLGVPAVIFVWAEGQSYQDDITRISQEMTDFEPEVCLAIKVSPISTSVDSPSRDGDDDVEDNSDVDSFLSSHGFEYIDATKEASKSSGSEGGRIHPEGISRLPRVLDALGTIMWPSMRKNSRNHTQRADDQNKQQGLLDWSQSSFDNSIATIEGVVNNSTDQLLDGTDDLQLEMRKLARWLEEDSLPHQDPWQSAVSTGAISTSPGSAEFTDATLNENKEAFVSGFDDDFTVFVSAPPADPADYSGSSSPDISPWNPSASLAPEPVRNLYRTLGSVSDFGGSDDGEQMAEIHDIDLPTETEIQATSLRIFGTSALPERPTSQSRDSTLHTTAEPESVPLESKIDVGLGEADDKLYDIAPFDLARVLSALQEMKAEISSMGDEAERRKAAAKVALGLVYGLEADGGVHTEPS
ncbi:hypothetical protein BDZ94DRAFT_1208571 [Collybia nuda]|uniref:Uncharacterized protein n=1 Tax=Collybia nuda TaxID=64659 RepID=A0A9P5YH26_9AGAR|nr:hypothetical protein BDZ94DRAFT_1208571 [Collybia nuda]